MSTTEKVFSVFLSWQSDSPEATNCNAMRKAIRAASKKLSTKSPYVKVSLDEATRGASGSPNIVEKITEKIRGADVFVADITTVTPSGTVRPCANPNVLFELGYAVAELGWDRVVLLFNQSIGTFPSDLPFDIAQNRVAAYSLNGDTHSSPAELDNIIHAAVQMVLKKNPKRPAELKGLDLASLKHQKDVESLNWILSQIWVPALNTHITNMPDRLNDNIFHSWEGFKSVLGNSLFHVYDDEIRDSLNRLLASWRTTLAFDGRYHDVHGGDMQAFRWRDPFSSPSEVQSDWDTIESARSAMGQAFTDLLDRVRSHFIEVDVIKTSATAYAEMIADRVGSE